MKRVLIFLIAICATVISYGQLDTVNIGTSANSGDGESLRSAFIKVNRQIKAWNDALMYNLSAAELATLNGVPSTLTSTELGYVDGVTSAIQDQLNAKQATLVSGTSIKTINGETLLGGGNIVIEPGEGASMVYPGAGIPISTGTEWGTSVTNNSVNWDSAYVARLRWSGTATGLTASTGRTSLGGTTIGQSMFTLSNPSAITFPRFNADNTVSALTAANFKTALSLTATDVSLGNVTNESKATMFTSPTFTTQVTLPATTYIPSLGVISFNSGDVTLTHGTNVLTLGGGDLALGTNNLTMTGSIGATGARITKGWFTDLDVTNALAIDITGNATTVTGYTRNSGSITLSGGHAITATTTATTAVTLPTTGTLATLTNINDSLTARIGAGVELSDVAVMLTDTATMLTPYIARGDTASMLTPYIARADTASMLTPYIARGDTATMLAHYAQITEVSAIVNDTIEARLAAAEEGVLKSDFEPDNIDVEGTDAIMYSSSDTLNPYVPVAMREDATTIFPTIQSAAGDTSNYATPDKIGDLYIDTSAGKVYVSVSSSRGGWRILNYLLPLFILWNFKRRRRK